MGFLLFILVLIAFTAAVSFGVAAVIRSNVLCIIAATAIAEGLIIFLGLRQAAVSRFPHDVLLGVNITWMFGTPVFIGSAVGFTLLARRVYSRRAVDTKK